MLRAPFPLLLAILLLAPLAAAHAGEGDDAPFAAVEAVAAPLVNGVPVTHPARTVDELAAISSLVVSGVPVKGDERDVVYSGGSQLVRRNTDVERELKALAAAHPDLVKVERHGTSAGGLPLWRAEVTNTKAAGEKLGIYLDGGHHGNEYLGAELVMVAIYHLVDNHGKDAEVTTLLDTHVVWATPILNPDGNLLDTRKNGHQVDINRNYPYEWGGAGAGKDVTALNYRGPSPASEPEIQAQIKFAETHKIDLWVTMHTGVAEMYWPWSYTDEAPPDNALFTFLEKPFEAASEGTLDAMQSAELYLAAGDTEDFAYGTFGIPAFVIEVHPDQFKPIYTEGTDSVIKGQFQGLWWLMQNTYRLGANVHVHDHESPGVTLGDGTATFWVHNKGWANAANVTFTLRQGDAILAQRVVDIAPDTHLNLTFEGLPSTQGLILDAKYSKLLINVSEVKSMSYDVDSRVKPAEAPKSIPGAPAALFLALAGVAAVVATRRLRG